VAQLGSTPGPFAMGATNQASRFRQPAGTVPRRQHDGVCSRSIDLDRPRPGLREITAGRRTGTTNK